MDTPAAPVLSLSRGQFTGRLLRFQLRVLQEPSRSRMTGFGEKDRRPIDPPPVVALSIQNADGTPFPHETLDYDSLMCHASIWSEDRIEPRSLVYNPSLQIIPFVINSGTGLQPFPETRLVEATMKMVIQNSTTAATTPPIATTTTTTMGVTSGGLTGQQLPEFGKPMRNLLGSLTAGSKFLRDDHGRSSVMFAFTDLAVRTEGTWTIKFTICDLDTRVHGGDPNAAPILASTFTEPFRVYTAKAFPGMKDSTPLTKALSRQGVKVILRKVGESDEGEDGGATP